MSDSNKAYEIVTDRILSALEENTVPWRKPWSLKPGFKPQNAITHRPYSGINNIMLGMAGFEDPRWLTFKKAIELGGHVTKGEKSTPIIFWKFLDVEQENRNGEMVEKKIPLLRYYSVFNVQQCEGLNLPSIEAPVAIEPIDAAENIISDMNNRPSIEHNGRDKAFYRPATDSIHLPFTWDFNSMEEYYSTAFHELGHSTGHSSRLNRHEFETGIAPFGSATYSREELVAEFTSAFLCNESGIENTIENSAAYISGWAKKIKSDNRLVVVAASQGQKAADYILGRNTEES